MGTGSVALDVVYQNLAKGRLEAGTQVDFSAYSTFMACTGLHRWLSGSSSHAAAAATTNGHKRAQHCCIGMTPSYSLHVVVAIMIQPQALAT